MPERFFQLRAVTASSGCGTENCRVQFAPPEPGATQMKFLLCDFATLRDTFCMLKRFAIALVAVALVLLLGVLIGFFFRKFSNANQPPQIYNTSTLLKQVQTISELSTVKYVFEKLVVLEDVKWYGENKVLLVAHGIVKAGIDFQKLETNDIRISEKKISITLPPSQITDAYLDDKKTQVLERTTGLMRSFDRDLEQNARRQAVDDLKRAARYNGILKEADERARIQLKNLFEQLGFNEVEFR